MLLRKNTPIALISTAWVTMSLMTGAHAQIANPQDPDAIVADAEAIDDVDAMEIDPWEGFNRKIFAVNNVVDGVVLVPAAKLYRSVTFKKERKGIRNFLDNLRTPVILVNDLLQGEFKRAGNTASRFVINSTIGFGGMGDPAERIGIPQHNEDFGQTLAVWGVDQGPYLVLPFFGPSTVRDGFGFVADNAFDPATFIRTDAASTFRYSRAGATAVSLREPLIEPLEEIRRNSLDQYASFRSFYLQSRKREIANGRTDFDDLPDIGDFDEFDDLE